MTFVNDSPTFTSPTTNINGIVTVSPSQLLLPRPSTGLTMTAPGNALSPPQLIDLSKSTLLAKRKDKAKYGTASSSMQDSTATGPMLDVTPAQLRMAMVEMILQ